MQLPISIWAPLPCSILCVTAAQKELEAVRSHLTEAFGKGSYPPESARSEHPFLRFIDSEHGHVWNLVCLSFQGTTEAAAEVQDLLSSAKLTPSLVLMIGMCMGMPKKRLDVGTVVVPNEVIALDHQRVTTHGIEYRPHTMRVDSGLQRLARLIASERDLKFRVIADKGLASASTKIEDPNAQLVTTIESTFPDVVAYDMEGAGAYRGARTRPFLWIKGVADRGEAQEPNANGLPRKHAAQVEATINATEFARRLVIAYSGRRRKAFGLLAIGVSITVAVIASVWLAYQAYAQRSESSRELPAELAAPEINSLATPAQSDIEKWIHEEYPGGTSIDSIVAGNWSKVGGQLIAEVAVVLSDSQGRQWRETVIATCRYEKGEWRRVGAVGDWKKEKVK